MSWRSKCIPPAIIALSVAIACALELLPLRFQTFQGLQRIESMTYDWRVRMGSQVPRPVSDKLAFVYIGDDTIDIFAEGRLGTNMQFGLYWPRHVYGRVVRELGAQGARAIGIDVLFAERRPDHPPVRTPRGTFSSDGFFQKQLLDAGNVVLGATPEVPPHPDFRDAAWSLADITTDRDADGVLRRVKLFRDYKLWNPQILAEARLNNWDLANATIRSNILMIPRRDNKPLTINVTSDGHFDPAELTGRKGASRIVRLQLACEDLRVWHLGVVLAARELGIDLSRAEPDLKRGLVTLLKTNGTRIALPVDQQGRMLIDWGIRQNDPRLTVDSFETLVARDLLRERGATPREAGRFGDKLVLIGSIASGNDLTDRGATPLEKDTFLTCNHWNVANSILTGRFISQSSTSSSLMLIALLALASGWVTLRSPTLWASAAVTVAAVLYCISAVLAFTNSNLSLPMITPLVGLLVTHVSLMSYLAFFQESERHRVRHIFSKIVSPSVVNELLRSERLSLGGTRREVTIMFADVRGFTRMTDGVHAEAEQYVREHNLSPERAAAYIDARSQEVLQAVNSYLGVIAETVKRHDGTLDKYIGDCVMAFWGAPASNSRHAVVCVRAAIDAQRRIAALNRERAELNRQREEENLQRLLQSEPPLPLLQTLSLGIGLNTGVATVGLMGSDEHLVNFTVFGREVNLAARLESTARGERIMIGQATYHALLRDDPALAAVCVELEPVAVKGFREPVKSFEVQWQEQPSEESFARAA